MASTIKVRAKIKEDVTEVKALISHPMDTGLVKDKKTGEVIPAHFIQEVVCKWKDKPVMTAYWSGGVSKNPYIAFKFKGAAKGDSIEISWVDNKGENDSTTATIG
ncbi:MAG: thiosulfate oxidation carrier complex protein SoxZ [Chromatiaceae bacterium]|jgi:sulfur-oxidizing protein SoxZ